MDGTQGRDGSPTQKNRPCLAGHETGHEISHEIGHWSEIGKSNAMPRAVSNLENLLKKDRLSVTACLIAVTVLAWVYLMILAADMGMGDSAPMGMGDLAGAMAVVLQPWTWVTFVLMGLMWWIMMIGMMIPSAAPMILIFAGVQRNSLPDENPGRRTGLFTLGYLVIWLCFSAGAAAFQWGLGEAALLSPMMVATSNALAAAILAATGIYQFTPLKQACLDHCRAPVQFLSNHWRSGDLGAFRMGLHHGAYCLGCCWFLMALLFIGGVMNLLWVAAIAVFVFLEKLTPKGVWVSRISGALMLGFAALMAGRALIQNPMSG